MRYMMGLASCGPACHSISVVCELSWIWVCGEAWKAQGRVVVKVLVWGGRGLGIGIHQSHHDDNDKHWLK